MSDDNAVDRGDDFEATGDVPGETGDQKEVKDAGTPDADAGDTGSEDADKGAKAEEDEKEPRIPKSRFDQAVKKARDAEKAALEKAEKLEAELATKKGTVDYEKLEADIETLEDELEDAIKDGNIEAKKRLRKEIRAKNSAMAESKAAAYSQYATAVAIEQITYNAAVERMEAEHPELNPDIDAYDEDLAAEVVDYKTAFEAKGESSTVALKKAIKAVFGHAAPKAPEKKAEAKEEEDETDKEDLKKKADAAAAKRKEDAVKKGLDTKGKQPTNEKAGIDSDKAGKSGKAVDVSKMSDKDFDKLEEDEKKRLRGDIL